MNLRTAVAAGLVASAMILAPLAASSAMAQSTPATMQIAQADTEDPALRLERAFLALKEAQKALRAAKKAGKGEKAASQLVRQARDEVKQARQAALAAARPADTLAAPESQATETASEQPPATETKTAAGTPPPIISDDPQARLDAAVLAVNDAQKAYRAAKKSGKRVNVARARLRAARDELNAAKQALADLGQPTTPTDTQQAAPTAPAAPAAPTTTVVTIEEPKAKTGIAGETIDPQVLELQKKLKRARRRAQKAEESAAEAQAKAAGGEVVKSESDRVIVKLGDQVIIRKQDENERFLRNADDVEVVQLSRGRTRTTVTRPNGVQIITVTNRYGEIIRRVRRFPDGREVVLIDNRQDRRPIVNFDIQLPRLVVPIPRRDYIVDLQRASEADIEAALTAPPIERVERIYSLEEVRRSERLRDKVRRIDLDTVTFDSGSAAISRSQIYTLTRIGEALEDVIYEDPDEIYLVEGHTDAVGSSLYNLALSDRRAESVAIILSESFDIPPENLITQGYGEDYLKIPTLADERRNRRVTIRRITPLIRADAQ